MRRVLIAAPIWQEPAVLQAFLAGIDRLDRSGADVHCLFIDDNADPQSSALLSGLRHRPGFTVASTSGALPGDVERRSGGAHHWAPNVVWRVAVLRDRLLGQAREGGFDHVLLVDSDLVLQRGTLQGLLAAGGDIVSEVFWTVWPGAAEPLPNVWACGQYQLFPSAPGERFTAEVGEVLRREWLDRIRKPGLHPVGGLGACTLISRRALAAGVSYAPIPSLEYWGEDRHFCIRAQVLGLSLWAHSDPQTEPLHLYRPADLDRLREH